MLSDIKFGFRQLTKNLGFTAIAVLTLALGIGVNTAMFSLLNALVFDVSKAPDADRLVCVLRTSPQSQDWPHSPANYYDYKKQATSFEHLAAYCQTNNNLSEPGQPAERLPSMMVTGEFFSIFRIGPLIGRLIGPDDDRDGFNHVAVLSEAFWKSDFASDPQVVGRIVRLDGQQYTIIGVAPTSLENPLAWGHLDLWTPMGLNAEGKASRGNNWMQIVGRLNPGVTAVRAQLEATAIAARLAHDYPDNDAGNSLRVADWNKTLAGDSSSKLSWLCMALAGFVLLIACANLANLQLARMSARLREHAVRLALGATRLQLVRQLLVENILLSILGGSFGVLLATWGTKFLGSEIVIGNVPGYVLPVDMRVLVFTIIASILTGVMVGVVPAWMSSGTNVNTALKQGSKGSDGGGSRHRIRQALVVGELALALLLLAGAGYFVRGMQRFTAADPGWKPDGLITADMSLPFNATYATDEQVHTFLDKLQSKMNALPGVSQSSVSASLPITGPWQSAPFLVEGRPIPDKGKEPLAAFDPVSPGYFSTVGIRLIEGRAVLDSDRAKTVQVAVINEAMARSLWPKESALGKRFREVDPDKMTWVQVVGVVADVHATLEVFRSLDTPFEIYRPLTQIPSDQAHWLSLALRSSAPASMIATSLRAAVQQIDADEPVYTILSARDAMGNITRGLELVSGILRVFALIGLLLAAVGIYGVIANVVAQRSTEIGIRMALGAQPSDVLWMVLGQGMRLSIIGTVIGVAASWGLFRLLGSILPVIHGSDPAAVLLIAAVLIAVALVACWLPARRATLVNPVVALRGD
ncbi:MAG TPA: ABC transporter permease [Opitutaceae bacterium]|nr:ABC transporter permease [Opitutaceae bacterium]